MLGWTIRSGPDSVPATTDRTSESPSFASSAPVTSGAVCLADNSCTFPTARAFTASDGSDADGGSDVSDLRRRTLYTFEDSIEACESYNSYIEDDETMCGAVTYNPNLTRAFASGKQGGNCLLNDKK